MQDINKLFSPDTLYLMDGTAFIFRSFYACQNMRRLDGFPTGAIYIFTRMLLQFLKTKRPKYFAFILDGHDSTFRHTIFPLYKMQRKNTPEDLIRQVDPILAIINALGLHTEISQGYEADDYLASIANRYRDKYPVVLLAVDKDLKQCLHPQVSMWDPSGKNQPVTLESFQQETGLLPSQWPDVQALVGDSSDNIPGIRGIGLKTAESLFRKYPDIESLEQNLNDLPARIAEKLHGQFEAMRLYRKLTTLNTKQCEKIRMEALKVRCVDAEKLLALLKEYELSSLEREARSMLRKGEMPVQSPEDTASQLSFFDIKARESEEISIQHVTDLSQIPDVSGRTLSLSRVGTDIVLALEHTVHTVLSCCLNEAKLAKRLTAAQRLIVYDVREWLRAHPAWFAIKPEQWFDIGLASYLLDPEQREQSRSGIVAECRQEIGHATQHLAALHAADRLQICLDNAGLSTLMRSLELPLIPILIRMEQRGIRLDIAALQEFLSEVQKELDALTEEVYQTAGERFNIRSAQQIGAILFTRLQLKPAGKTKGGRATTSQDALEALASEHPLVGALLRFRKLEKLRSTYLEPLPKSIGADGRVHTHFNQLSTATGRLSSSGPNLQNIPVRGNMGPRMRACFTADPGHLLLSADYSQIELRVLAHFSQDPTLMQAFRDNADIHTRTASLIFDLPQEEITSDMRRSAKTVNFGLLYGMGPQKLAKELQISLKQARAFIARYFEKLGCLRAFYTQVEQEACAKGYVITISGRRRLLPDLQSESAQAKALAKRQAVNTIIQGSAADIIKIAMLNADQDARLAELGARLILQIHDELILEVPERNAQEAGKRIEEIMSSVAPGGIPLSVPLRTDWNYGKNWGEAHS
ncbi:MAG: DNA polymerase I [Desulfovibrionaceae bacterium]|nr:DNA polymerase I [Desulfovibrionaceae bacterium]